MAPWWAATAGSAHRGAVLLANQGVCAASVANVSTALVAALGFRPARHANMCWTNGHCRSMCGIVAAVAVRGGDAAMRDGAAEVELYAAAACSAALLLSCIAVAVRGRRRLRVKRA